jgi:nitrite reductase/ring-hydroxylating ferredoxin subunit
MKVPLSENQRIEAAAGRFVRVDLPRPVLFGDERARQAFVGCVEGTWRAWANVCRHRQVALDFNAPPQRGDVRLAPLGEDGFHLVCHSHGALYRPDDGTCISGPCPDARLHAIEVVADDTGVALEIPDV